MAGSRMVHQMFVLDTLSNDDCFESATSISESSSPVCGVRCVVKNTFLQFGEPDEIEERKNSRLVRSQSAPKTISHAMFEATTPSYGGSHCLSDCSDNSSFAAIAPRGLQFSSPAPLPYLSYLTMDAPKPSSHADVNSAGLAAMLMSTASADFNMDRKTAFGYDDFDDTSSTDTSNSFSQPLPTSESEMCESFGAFRASYTDEIAYTDGIAAAQRAPASPTTMWNALPHTQDIAYDMCNSPEDGTVSDLHSAGQCNPCLYHVSKRGCMNGSACRFCHLSHKKKNRPRPCKAARLQCKQTVNNLREALGEKSQEFKEASQLLSKDNSYIHLLLQPKH